MQVGTYYHADILEMSGIIASNTANHVLTIPRIFVWLKLKELQMLYLYSLKDSIRHGISGFLLRPRPS